MTILPPEGPLYVNLYCQIASRIIQNLQQFFLNMGSTPPPPFEQCKKKTDDLVPWGVPYSAILLTLDHNYAINAKLLLQKKATHANNTFHVRA